jgi:hypothetical protein
VRWSPLPARYADTRVALHTVAEHVVAAARYQVDGHIGLRPVQHGFGTPTVDGRRVEVLGIDLVTFDGIEETREPITTLRSAGTFVGIEPGMPPSVYRPATPLDLDAGLEVDPDAADALAAWFELVADALGRFTAHHRDESPGLAQLWPEHFDYALPMGEVNYGGSPGDAQHSVPYLYVGPFTKRDGPFWNEPFGASRPASAVTSVDDAAEFYEAGWAEARSG